MLSSSGVLTWVRLACCHLSVMGHLLYREAIQRSLTRKRYQRLRGQPLPIPSNSFRWGIPSPSDR